MSTSRPASSGGGTHPKVGVNGLHVDVALSRFISQSFASFHKFSLRFTGFHFHSIQHERKFLGIHASLLPSTRLCSSAKQTPENRRATSVSERCCSRHLRSWPNSRPQCRGARHPRRNGRFGTPAARDAWQDGWVWYQIVARSQVLYPPFGKSHSLVPERARRAIRDLGFLRALGTKPLEVGRNRGTKPANLAGAALKTPSAVPNWRSWQRAAIARDDHRAPSQKWKWQYFSTDEPYSASRLKRTVCCFMDILPTSHPWGTSSFL